ncbi:MAG: SpoIIE family protein phosphatase [bacterium]
MILTSLALLIGIINIYFLLEILPQKNDECLWLPTYAKDKNQLAIVFSSVKKNGVTYNAGIRNGDILLAINNHEIENTTRAQFHLNFVKAGDSALYKIEHEGKIIETKVEVKKLIQFGPLAFTSFSIIWMLVGIIVLTAKPDGRSQKIFYAIGFFSILSSTYILLNPNFGHNPVAYIPWLVTVVNLISTIGLVFLSFLILHFFLLFPKEKKILKKKFTKRILYFIPFTIALYLISIIIDLLPHPPNFDQAKTYILFIWLIFILLACFIILLVSYAELNSKTDRKHLSVIVIAYAVGIASIIYTTTIANFIAENIFNDPEYFTPIILIVLVPISFAYSIFKYSLMDVTDVLKNAITYGIATISIAAFYFLIIYFLGQNLSSFIGSDYQGVLAGVMFIGFAILFQSTKDKFQEILTRRFYPEQFAYQKVLLRFSSDIRSVFGLENILDSTNNTFIEALNLKRFGIIIKNFNNGAYELKRHKDLESVYSFDRIDEAYLYLLLNDKFEKQLLPVFEMNEFEQIFPEDYKALIDDGIYTIIPLVIKTKVTGFLLFGLKHSGAQFAGKDLELLVAAANQTALSIENARLYESEAAKLKMESELENARKIQENLLPKSFPALAGIDIAGIMIPAMHIGGDYFDVISIDENKFYVIIGDVSGKGLSASLYMSKLQTIMRLYCTGEKSPVAILKDINKHVYQSFERNWFITISLALFDVKNNSIKFCRAGHTPLVMLNNGEIKNYQPSGIGLGLENGNLFDSVLEEIELPLKEKSIYFFYSDGVNEAMNDKHEVFDSKRIEESLSQNFQLQAKEILAKLIVEINSFRNGHLINDDLTCVVIKTL